MLYLDQPIPRSLEQRWKKKLDALYETRRVLLAPVLAGGPFDQAAEAAQKAIEAEISTARMERNRAELDFRRLNRLLRFENGDLEKMRALGEEILLLDPAWIDAALNLPKSEGAGVKIVLRHGEKFRLSAGGAGKLGWIPLSHPFMPLLKTWAGFFGPQLDETAWQHLAAQYDASLTRFAFEIFPAKWPSDTNPISAHEHTERLLQTGEWLNKRVGLSPAKVQSLLQLSVK